MSHRTLRSGPASHSPTPFGDYLLLRRIGVGGMAEVFEAQKGDRRVALKRLLPDLRMEPQVVSGFIDEAQICSELSHPNVVAVYDFGDVDGVHFMTMELCDGPDLQILAQRAQRRFGALPLGAVAYVGYQVACGLQYIHTHKRAIVHRDVTPHNIFLTRNGEAKLADFGVAFANERLTKTQAGFVKGKLCYLAPEQVRGDPLTPRTDIFAAGLLLYELITGERANKAEGDLNLIEWAMNPQCPPPSAKVPAARPFDRIIAQALERSAAVRTRDAVLLAEQLMGVLRLLRFGRRDLARLIAMTDPHGVERSAPPRSSPRRTHTRRPSPGPAGLEEQTTDEVTEERSDEITGEVTGEVHGAVTQQVPLPSAGGLDEVATLEVSAAQAARWREAANAPAAQLDSTRRTIAVPPASRGSSHELEQHFELAETHHVDASEVAQTHHVAASGAVGTQHLAPAERSRGPQPWPWVGLGLVLGIALAAALLIAI